MNCKINNSNQNNITFKTRIVFLSPKGFRKVFGAWKNKNFANICHFDITNNENDRFSCYKTNIKRGYTKGIKTCTAGVCVNKGEKAPLFWHIENTHANIENFPIISNIIQGTNAIIIGSKNNYKHSKELFEKFVEEMKCKSIPTTLIQGTKHSEAHMMYESTNDALYVCINDIYKKDNYVKSIEDLQNTCDFLKISQNDSIEFYDTLPQKTIKQSIENLIHKIF